MVTSRKAKSTLSVVNPRSDGDQEETLPVTATEEVEAAAGEEVEAAAGEEVGNPGNPGYSRAD